MATSTLATPSTTLEALQAVAMHPAGFGVGVGIANGLLAEARGLPFTTKSAVITALVIGAGEAALAADLPHTRSLVETAGYSALGTLIGLWPFVGAEGKPSPVRLMLNKMR